MKIPTDLKPGDRLWYFKTEYATVGEARNNVGDPYFHGESRVCATDDACRGRIASIDRNGKTMNYWCDTGEEYDHDTPPIIRIERIASAKPNRRLAAAKEPLPRSIIRSILRWEKERRGGETQMSEAVRIVRAIARRLENKKCPANASPAVGGSAGRTGSSRAVSRNSRAAGVAVE